MKDRHAPPSDPIEIAGERGMTVITLGQKARDKVTGVEGILTAKANYIYGCDQYCLVPLADKDGKLPDAHWFDEGRIE